MSNPIKRSAFFLSAVMAGLFAVYAPPSWSGDNNQQRADGAKAKGAHGMDHGSMKGMDHGAMKGMDHGSMKGMDHDAMKGMDHGSMQGMDHGKMMESHGSDKAEAGKDAQ
ncbi:Copper resistance protein B precursor [compost metagenome]